MGACMCTAQFDMGAGVCFGGCQKKGWGERAGSGWKRQFLLKSSGSALLPVARYLVVFHAWREE